FCGGERGQPVRTWGHDSIRAIRRGRGLAVLLEGDLRERAGEPARRRLHRAARPPGVADRGVGDPHRRGIRQRQPRLLHGALGPEGRPGAGSVDGTWSNGAAEAALVAESQWVAEVTGGENTLTPIPASWLAAMRGHEKQAEQLIAGTLNDAIARGQGVGLNMMYFARAVLGNGLGRYEDALAAAREAATEP